MLVAKDNLTDTMEDFTVAARRTAHKIGEILRKRTAETKQAGKPQYQELLAMTEKTTWSDFMTGRTSSVQIDFCRDQESIFRLSNKLSTGEHR